MSLLGSGILSSIPKVSWLLLLLVTYPFMQQYLRYSRLRAMKKRYNYHTRGAMAKMTDTEAWEIMKNLAELEFCTMFEKGKTAVLFPAGTSMLNLQPGLQFALFRVRH